MLCSTTMNNVHAHICFMTPWVKPCPVKHGRSSIPRTTKLRIHEYQGHSVPLFEVSLGQTPASYTTLESIFQELIIMPIGFARFVRDLCPRCCAQKPPKIKFPKSLKTICLGESSRQEDVTNEFCRTLPFINVIILWARYACWKNTSDSETRTAVINTLRW